PGFAPIEIGLGPRRPTAPVAIASKPWRSLTAALQSGMPDCHVARVRWSVGAGAEVPIVEVRIDVVGLDQPHEMDGVGAAGKATVGLEDVVAYRLGAGDAFVADLDRAGTMLALGYQIGHGVRRRAFCRLR